MAFVSRQQTGELSFPRSASRTHARNHFLILLATVGCFVQSTAQVSSSAPQVHETAGQVHILSSEGTMQVEMSGENVLRVDVQPEGKTSPRTLVMDPNLKLVPYSQASMSEKDGRIVIRSQKMTITINRTPPFMISVSGPNGEKLVEEQNPFADAASHSAIFLHQAGENLYGMSGIGRRENGVGLLRNSGALVAAGSQGEAGGPWFFTTHFGVLIDSDGGAFDTRDDLVQFSGNSRQELEYFVISGPPLDTISGLSNLTGRPPLPPKWTLGFLNSQWGATEAEIRQIAATYRAKHIPLDAFIFDFDWKAWGEDNYGEWRWNSTSTPESYSPDKFPEGASGKLAQDMRRDGIKLAGILKPRILLYRKGSTSTMHEAAAYADAHHLWYPEEPKTIDYVTGREARDLDFSKSETREWFWKHLEPAFDAGMAGWWNDEADETNTADGQVFKFDNFQFMNMGRALYEGQRAYSNQRVWSINRNYYVGAPRYGYAEWSGDIQSGFVSMAQQRARMLATLDLGEPHWSMDTGGFFGLPTDENYARWMEFAAFVPIDRVHGEDNEKRQPWVYGPVAEQAAVKAIRLRYQLLPYMYSNEHNATETGIGIVRPLFWAFPDDPQAANDSSSWMFGDALLFSPVVTAGESDHVMYLPAGTWFDYFRGNRMEGGRTIHYPVDPKTWQDMPLFVRSGSILATRPVQDYVGQTAATEITLDVFPGPPCKFSYYDDDGKTYAYEEGESYQQTIHAENTARGAIIEIKEPKGLFHSALKDYILRVHEIAANAVAINGKEQPIAGKPSLALGQWTIDHDRFGPSTIIRVQANQATKIILRTNN